MEPNQVIWTTRCKVMAKYISIYFDMHYENVFHSGLPTARYFFLSSFWETRGTQLLVKYIERHLATTLQHWSKWPDFLAPCLKSKFKTTLLSKKMILTNCHQGFTQHQFSELKIDKTHWQLCKRQAWPIGNYAKDRLDPLLLFPGLEKGFAYKCDH